MLMQKNQTSITVIILLAGLLGSAILLAKDSFLIEQLHNKYQNISYYQANFTQTKNVAYISKPLITTGQLEFALNTGLIWEVHKPLWVRTLITSKGVYKSTKYKTKQKVKDLQIKLIAEIMTELLTANLDKVASQFNIVTTNVTDNHWEVHLIPKGLVMQKTLHKIILKGQNKTSSATDGISEIIIIDKANNTTSIVLEETQLSYKPLTTEIRSKFET